MELFLNFVGTLHNVLVRFFLLVPNVFIIFAIQNAIGFRNILLYV